MPLPLKVVLVPERLLERCRSDADRHFPLETGGVLMGYQHEGSAFVTEVIGAGPDAVHRTHSFEPDYPWQTDRIAKHYLKSGRRETYLGDWHTHPRARSGILSGHDRSVVRKIIRTPEARAAQPLMGIFYGVPQMWDLAVWSGRLVPSWFGIQKLDIHALAVQRR